MPKITLKTTELADFFGVTRKTIAEWHKAGCPQVKRGIWDLKIVHEWWFENIAKSKIPDDESLAEAKRKYWTAKAQNEELKAQYQEGKLVSWEEVTREWAKRAAEYKNGCFELENSLPPLLEGKIQSDMRKIIYEKVWSLFDRVCRTGTFCPKGKNKKK